MKMNKRADTMVLGTVIFIILNIIFFVVMVGFVYSSGNRDFVYEQTYAKEVALMIDKAEPEMAILLDISKLIEIAEENKKPTEEIFKINKNENKIFVSLSGERGYSYKYFSDVEVDIELDGKYLSINIGK